MKSIGGTGRWVEGWTYVINALVRSSLAFSVAVSWAVIMAARAPPGGAAAVAVVPPVAVVSNCMQHAAKSTEMLRVRILPQWQASAGALVGASG